MAVLGVVVVKASILTSMALGSNREPKKYSQWNRVMNVFLKCPNFSKTHRSPGAMAKSKRVCRLLFLLLLLLLFLLFLLILILILILNLLLPLLLPLSPLPQICYAELHASGGAPPTAPTSLSQPPLRLVPPAIAAMVVMVSQQQASSSVANTRGSPDGMRRDIRRSFQDLIRLAVDGGMAGPT